MPLQLEIVTPERLAYSDSVDSVQCPGIEGELGILPHHAPLLSTLGYGELRIRKGGHEATPELVAEVLAAAKRGNRVLTDDEIASLIRDHKK